VGSWLVDTQDSREATVDCGLLGARAESETGSRGSGIIHVKITHVNNENNESPFKREGLLG
jgi:hypothetical protein